MDWKSTAREALEVYVSGIETNVSIWSEKVPLDYVNNKSQISRKRIRSARDPFNQQNNVNYQLCVQSEERVTQSYQQQAILQLLDVQKDALRSELMII